MSFLIKICGITRVEDGLEAAALGADALGFMFHERSARHVTTAAAAAISRELPRGILRVGVFVNATAERIEAAVEECGLNLAQLHGSETPEFCAGIRGAPVVKAFRVADEKSLAELKRYRTAYWLLDSYVPGAEGGTGRVFNWPLARAARGLGTPFWLAGGLEAGNVADAIRQARSDGVDVSSGVESEPGRKDRAKMKAFIEAARAAAAELREEGLAKA